MLFINHLQKDEWWEWDQEKMRAYNYRGGHYDIDENSLGDVEYVECNSWHELYLKKHFCPLEVESWWNDVWISPDGRFYDGVAHDVTAEHLLSIIYGEETEWCAGDALTAKGWLRATTSAMWKIRLPELIETPLTQKQYNALFDWCQHHKITFPTNLKIK
jgi:hypothetical protein